MKNEFPGRIKAIALDVDGVLTDGTFTWDTNGVEYKSFCFLDIMGVSIGSQAGLSFFLISGEASPLVDRIASKLGIADVYKGCKDKAQAFKTFCEKSGFKASQICFMGDDVNDLEALGLAGLSVAPANAHESVKAEVMMVTRNSGGRGAVRELIDFILSETKKIE